MASKNIDFHVELSPDTFALLYDLFASVPARKRAERARMLLEKGRMFESMEGSVSLVSSRPADRVASPTPANNNKARPGKLDESLGKDLSDLFP